MKYLPACGFMLLLAAILNVGRIDIVASKRLALQVPVGGFQSSIGPANTQQPEADTTAGKACPIDGDGVPLQNGVILKNGLDNGPMGGSDITIFTTVKGKRYHLSGKDNTQALTDGPVRIPSVKAGPTTNSRKYCYTLISNTLAGEGQAGTVCLLVMDKTKTPEIVTLQCGNIDGNAVFGNRKLP